MSQHLPLVAAQPGIWMAEKLSDLPSAWSVAHYVELTGEVDAPLLARAVVAGLAQADTLRMRFTEDNGEVWQWVDDAQTFELPEIIDLRTNIDPHGTARALMQADLQQDLRVDSGKPLVFHQLIQVADNRWYWYQRYHHLLVDGFSFPVVHARSPTFTAHCCVANQRLLRRLRLSLMSWKSTSNTAKVKPGSVMRHSGRNSVVNYRPRHFLRHLYRGAALRQIFCA